MKQFVSLFILSIATLFFMVACEGKKPSVRHIAHLGDTPYQQDSIQVVYATDPVRALTLLDSALLLGNISEYRGQFIRAKIYGKSLEELRIDSAIIICEALLDHDSACNEPTEQENILDLLIATARAKHDNEAYMRWATQKAELCQKQGEENERWRTEADIGYVMTSLGQVDEGLQKLDEAIGHLDSPGSIDRMDAFIVACKRKINALIDLHRFDEVITLGQRILDRLDHYEQHAGDYAEDSYRLSWSDHPSDRDRYLDFSRAQAWGFLAQSYALLNSGERQEVRDERILKAREYLALFDQTDYGKTFAARRMIAPAQMALGMYDEALVTYDEIERRMAGDTLNDDYAVILRSRAIAAYAKAKEAEANSSLFTLHSSLKQAYSLMTRYANLSKAVSDSLHRSEAHEYAARYHAQEQQFAIQEKEAEAKRSHIINIALAIGLLIVLVAAVYIFYQKRIVNEKNRALVRMINEQAFPRDLTAEQSTHLPHKEGVGESLFKSIDTAIRTERLYTNNGLQRQDICDRFDISRHTLNDLLAEHTGGLSFPQYVNTIRLEEALHLLRDDPQKTISAIATEVGFSSANLREQFKRKYGITPIEYRQNMNV